LQLSPTDEVDNFDVVSALDTIRGVLVAWENVTIHFNSDAPFPEPQFFNQIGYGAAVAAVAFFAIEHYRHGVSP
jgi:hypothetical protein